MKRCTFACLSGAALLALAGCEPHMPRSADVAQQQRQEVLQAEAIRQVGIPNITRFTEMKRMRYLYELRDRADLTCWIYTRDLNGQMHLIGVGMGYPIPYGTQFSSPEKLVSNGGHSGGALANIPVPQSEPNGLFMPPTAEASWVILMTKNGPKPYYGEVRLEGSPERIRGADESKAIWPDGKPIPAEQELPPPAAEKDIQTLEAFK